MKQHIGEIIEGRPLYHAERSENVREVARRMSEWNVGAIAILDSGNLAGIFSERDLMTRVVAQGLDPASTAVDRVMTRELTVGDPGDDIDTALRKMHAVNCRHLPIVDHGHLLGMLSLRDLLQVDDDQNRQRASFLKELVTYSPDYES